MKSYSHHGQFVKEYLDRLGFNKSAVARNASLSKQGLNDALKRARLDEDLLERLGKAVNFDFVAEFDKQRISNKLSSTVSEPQAPYENPPDVQIIFSFNLDDDDRLAKASELIRLLSSKDKKED